MEEIAVLARRLLDGEPDEERLAQCADEALHQALGYCGLTELPEGLRETVARRAALLYEGGAVASGRVRCSAASVRGRPGSGGGNGCRWGMSQRRDSSWPPRFPVPSVP